MGWKSYNEGKLGVPIGRDSARPKLYKIEDAILRIEFGTFPDRMVFLPPVIIINGAGGQKIEEDHWAQPRKV